MSLNIRRTAEQWKQIIQEQQSSGLTQKAFCGMHNISLSSFSHWNRRLSAATDDNSTGWIDVTKELGGLSSSSAGWKIELDLGNGVVLRLSQQGE